MPKLAAVVMACNEDNILSHCLQSVQGLAELHVSIDLATTDNTEAVARQFTQNIYHHDFSGDSFAAARNAVQEQVEAATEAEWFVWLDPDEWLDEGADLLPKLLEAADDRNLQALMVRMWDVPPPGSTTIPSSWMNCKFFRRGLRFSRRRHEHLPSNILRGDCPEVIIKHQKAQRPEVQAACNARKADLDALLADWQDFPDQRSAYYVGDAYIQRAEWHTAIAWFTVGLQCPDEIQGARAQLLGGLAKCYRLTEQPERARSAVFELWSEDWRNSSTALFDLGCIATAEEKLEEAALWFRLLNAMPQGVVSVTNVAVENPQELAMFGASLVHAGRGKHPEAIEALTKALELGGVDRPQYKDLRQKIVAAMTGGQ